MNELARVEYRDESGQLVRLDFQTVRAYLVQGARDAVTEAELALFLATCAAARLNPFRREVYLVKISPEEPAAIIVAKDTFVRRATRHPDCQGWQAGIIVQTAKGELIRREGALLLPGETLVGGWARIYRKGWANPFYHEVALSEAIRKRKDGTPTRFWREIPATMVRKVALVQALREVFPEELAALYAPEEMPHGEIVQAAEEAAEAAAEEAGSMPVLREEDVVAFFKERIMAATTLEDLNNTADLIRNAKHMGTLSEEGAKELRALYLKRRGELLLPVEEGETK